MKKRIISIALCAATCAATLTFGGCSCNGTPPTTETVNLTLWGPAEHKNMLGEMVNEFKSANPNKNYNITINVVSEADAFNTISTDVSAGADVYAFINDQIINLYRAGALAQVGGTNLNNITMQNDAGAVNSAKVGEDVYAYPFSADNGYFLYYDKSVITDPTSLNTILADCKTASKKFVMELDNSWYVASFFFGTGCSYEVEYDAEGAVKSVICDFDDENKGVKAGTAMVNLAGNAAFLNGDDNVIKAGFADGSVAAAVSGTWNAESIKAALGENYAASPLPKFTVGGENFQMSSFAGYKLYGVNPTSKNLAEAHKLAAFLSSESMQKKRYEEVGIGPSNINAAASEEVKQNVALSALTAQSQFAVAQTAVPDNYWKAADAFGTEVVSKAVNKNNLLSKLKEMTDLIRSVSSSSN